MKILHTAKDGGKDSTVWGFWLIEWKRLFSVALLVFENGSREAFHSHAFNSISWVLRGRLSEERMYVTQDNQTHEHTPNLLPVITKRDNMHKVTSVGRTYVLTLRGPWAKEWQEWRPNEQKFVTLTDGRVERA